MCIFASHKTIKKMKTVIKENGILKTSLALVVLTGVIVYGSIWVIICNHIL